jgi:hypothetical protein
VYRLTDSGAGTAQDHYKQFIIGVVADDIWLSRYGVEGAVLASRGWTPKETTIKIARFLEFLVDEWVNEGAGDSSHREKSGLMPQPIR